MADYHSLLMRAVANLPNSGTPATRAAIYGRARNALLEQLRSLRPPLPESDITREERALDAAIAEIEERYGSQDAGSTPRVRRPRRRPRLQPESRRGACEDGPTAPAPAILHRPAPERAFGARAGQRPRRDRLRNRVRQRNPRLRSAPVQARGAATSAAGAGTEPASRDPAASASPARGTAGRSGADGGFAGSIPTGCCHGQPALLRSRAGRAAPSVRARGSEDEGLPGVAALDPAQGGPTEQDRRRGRRSARHDCRAPLTTKPCNRPRRRKSRPSSTALAWLPDRRRKSSARSRRAPRSPSRNACCGSPRRSSLALSLRWRAAAILMRQKPQDLAIKPPVETQQPASPGASGEDR